MGGGRTPWNTADQLTLFKEGSELCPHTTATQRDKITEKVHKPPLEVNVIDFNRILPDSKSYLHLCYLR